MQILWYETMFLFGEVASFYIRKIEEMREVHQESYGVNRCDIVVDNHHVTGDKHNHKHRQTFDGKTRRSKFNISKKYATNL